MKNTTTKQQKKELFFKAVEVLECLTTEAVRSSTTIEHTKRTKHALEKVLEWAERLQNEIF